MRAEDEILFETAGQIGIVTLNRPRALNALSLGMIRAMDRQLAAWAADPRVGAVVVRGAGGKAFCAGGDVRAVWQAGMEARQEGHDAAARLRADFFREEYILNHRIHFYPKPYVALVDGIAMGGGVGLSVHGSHRVVTERTLFAMPETGIGLFPDVGGGWFLPRCPGEVGTYLGLTGARIGAGDCGYIGFGTHFVPSARLEDLVAALAEADLERGGARAVDGVIARFAGDCGPAPLAALRSAIDRCFSFNSVEEILVALEREEGDWAAEAREILAARSPTSLKITLRQLREGRHLPYEEVVTLEYRLSQRCTAAADFYEGVRAVLIDKDQRPRWEPAAIPGVQDADVDRYFQPLGDGDLVLGRTPKDHFAGSVIGS
jgi:enoyl-CoA hydratase